MSYWRSGTFWASAIAGWFVAICVFAVLIRVAITEESGMIVGLGAFAALVLLPLVADYSYGRRQFELQTSKTRGFLVITKDD